MNITFLIGNGFDVGVGMKSKFKDFFPVYKEKSTDKPEKIRQLADEIENDYDTWADFEVALGKYTELFNEDTKVDFIEQVKDFEEAFIEYLKEEEKTLLFDNLNEIETKMKKAILEFGSVPNLAPDSVKEIVKVYNAHGSENHNYHFVNFNYTHILESCLETISENIVRERKYGAQDKADKIGTIVHVHGDCELYPIIGVNDTEQIINKELAKDEGFTRYIVKPSLNKLLRQGNDLRATNLIQQSTIICVYGMALGKTDKKWWDLLVRWLSGSSDRHLIIYDYDEKYTTSNQFGWLEKEDSIIKKLNEYNTDSRIKIELLRPRIHVAVHKNIFSMNIPRRNKDEWKVVLAQIEAEKNEQNIN